MFLGSQLPEGSLSSSEQTPGQRFRLLLPDVQEHQHSNQNGRRVQERHLAQTSSGNCFWSLELHFIYPSNRKINM